MNRFYLGTLVLISFAGMVQADDIRANNERIQLAAGFGDFFGELTNSLTNAAVDRATQEADEAINQAVNRSPPPAAGVPWVAPVDPQVREIQQRLSELGYSPGPADGVMGQKTRLAIYAYQQSLGVPADGKPSGQLLSTLRSQAGYQGQSKPAPAALKTYEIAEIQQHLIDRGFAKEPVNGRVDIPTQAAIYAYQQSLGMPADGKPSGQLLSMLRSQTGSSEGSMPEPATMQTHDIAEIQRHLSALGFAPGTVNGNVDTRTESAIYAYQREFGLKADGEPSMRVLRSLRAEALAATQSGLGPRPDPIKIPLAADMMRAEKTLFYECERELNHGRRLEGIAEIRLISSAEAKKAAQKSQATNQTTALGNAAVTMGNRDAKAEIGAVKALSACVSAKTFAKH